MADINEQVQITQPSIIKVRRGTKDEWARSDYILKDGEPGYDTTNKICKIGNGVSSWADLSPMNKGDKGDAPIKGRDYFTYEDEQYFQAAIFGQLSEAYDSTEILPQFSQYKWPIEIYSTIGGCFDALNWPLIDFKIKGQFVDDEQSKFTLNIERYVLSPASKSIGVVNHRPLAQEPSEDEETLMPLSILMPKHLMFISCQWYYHKSGSPSYRTPLTTGSCINPKARITAVKMTKSRYENLYSCKVKYYNLQTNQIEESFSDSIRANDSKTLSINEPNITSINIPKPNDQSSIEKSYTVYRDSNDKFLYIKYETLAEEEKKQKIDGTSEIDFKTVYGDCVFQIQNHELSGYYLLDAGKRHMYTQAQLTVLEERIADLEERIANLEK